MGGMVGPDGGGVVDEGGRKPPRSSWASRSALGTLSLLAAVTVARISRTGPSAAPLASSESKRNRTEAMLSRPYRDEIIPHPSPVASAATRGEFPGGALGRQRPAGRRHNETLHPPADAAARFESTMAGRGHRPRQVLIWGIASGALRVHEVRGQRALPGGRNESVPTDEKAGRWWEGDPEEDDGECVSRVRETSSSPNCNAFHELDVAAMRVISSGVVRIALEAGDRSGWKFAGDRPGWKFVYKSLRLEAKYLNWHLGGKKQRTDVLVLDRTSSSRFIPDVYGYCGAAILMEHVPDGDLLEHIKAWRTGRAERPAHEERLKIAIHVAGGVADLHEMGGTGPPSWLHNDLKPEQYLYGAGVFRLNDFHQSKQILVNATSGAVCRRGRYGLGFANDRSLEEIVHRKDMEPIDPSKVDVWMMGNVIYSVLTDREVFEGFNKTEAAARLAAGGRSPLPRRVRRSGDPATSAMRNALGMCWRQDWRERPSAREVATYLTERLGKIADGGDPDLRVDLPRAG